MNSNNQGKDTSTVLTNLSNYITVVSNEPYSTRKVQRYGLPALRMSDEGRRRRSFRGVRPLHQTTLSFEASPVDSKYLSTMKESFSGKSDFSASKQPTRCPSLHTSHLKFGMNSANHFITTSKDGFLDHSKQPITAHVDRARWKMQMAGGDMINSTRYKGCNDIDFATTYSKNHQEFSPVELYQPQCPLYGQWKTSIFNISTGQTKMRSSQKFNLISGNQVLHKTRTDTLTSQFC